MLVRARRPTASLCIAMLALNTVACTHVRQVEAQTIIQPSGGSVPMEKIVGVTLKDGRHITVAAAAAAASAVGDSLQGF